MYDYEHVSVCEGFYGRMQPKSPGEINREYVDIYIHAQCMGVSKVYHVFS